MRRNTGGAVRAAAGFTLIELMVVLTLVSVLMLLIVSTLWGTVRIERADAAAFHRMTVQARLADQFREDVAQAFELPTTRGELQAGPHCLILRFAADRQVIYRWENDHLRRTELIGDDRSERSMPVGGDWVSVTFEQSAEDPSVVSMRLIESRGRGQSRREHPVEIAAALGGDQR